MRTLATVLVSCGLILFSIAFAQNESPETNEPSSSESTSPQKQLTPEEIAEQQREAEEAAEQACAVCGGSVVFLIVGILGLIALNIAILIWVARDSKNRGMDSSVLWMFLVMFTGIIGLVIYMFSRPQGQMAQCPSCNGKRLAASAKCPHCQNP